MRVAVPLPEEVGKVRVPVRAPVAVGEKTTWTKQVAAGARVPVQGDPPVGAWLMAKSPVTVGAVRVMVEC